MKGIARKFRAKTLMGFFDFLKKNKDSEDVVEATEENLLDEQTTEIFEESVVESVEESVEILEEESADIDIIEEDTEETEDAIETEDAEDTEETDNKDGWFNRLKSGLSKTRNSFVKNIENVFKASELDDDFYEELEEVLVMADIGIYATEKILDDLKEQVKKKHIKEASECKQILIDSIREQMNVSDADYDFENTQTVILVIGVNGVGKTTSIGKLAGNYKNQGKKVLIAAADTFRAAATEQLVEWSNRAGVEIIAAKEGADPASVVYDAVAAAKARNVDVLLIDTAGRLHNKKNLMAELGKMNKIIDKDFPDAHRENFIVLDGTTGQNALVQAKEFKEVANLTGIILTKMDGTAKGGIAVAIQSELTIPVKYIGVGEKMEDLQRFNPDEFVRALFD